MVNKNKAYLLLLADEHCRDMDKWIGIYTDVEKLKQDYDKAWAELNARAKEEEPYLKVKIYEFGQDKYFSRRDCEYPREVKAEELILLKKVTNDNSELLSCLAALSEAWKDLIEKTEGERPDVPLLWSVNDGLLCLDGKWICPVEYADMGKLEDRELSSLVSAVTIVLPLTEGYMDLIITKELGRYEFSVIERRV